MLESKTEKILFLIWITTLSWCLLTLINDYRHEQKKVRELQNYISQTCIKYQESPEIQLTCKMWEK